MNAKRSIHTLYGRSCSNLFTGLSEERENKKTFYNNMSCFLDGIVFPIFLVSNIYKQEIDSVYNKK